MHNAPRIFTRTVNLTAEQLAAEVAADQIIIAENLQDTAACSYLHARIHRENFRPEHLHIVIKRQRLAAARSAAARAFAAQL